MDAFQEAMAFHRQGNISEAESLCRKILKGDSRNFHALYMLGVICAQRERFGEAERLLRTALTVEQGKPSCYHTYGKVLCELARYGDAINSFNRVLELTRDYPEIYLDRAFAQMKLEHFQEALASFENALTLDRQSSSAHYGRGVALEKLKRYEEALKSYDHALARDPQYALAYCNRGAVLYELKRYLEALASCDRSLAINSGLALAHRNRAGILYQLKRYPEALASCDRALALDPNFAQAHCDRASVLYKLKRFENALVSCEKAIVLQPDLAQAFINRGDLLEALKRSDEALSSYDKAIALKPDFAEVFNNRGYVLLALGRLEEASASFGQAVALAPDKAAYHYGLTNSRHCTAADPYFATMQELARKEGSLETDEKILLHFALAKAFADLGDSRQSFHHLLQGSSLKRQQVDYREATTLGIFDRIRTVFSTQFIGEKRGLGDPSDIPIFIVGMPRSGTTLVEQILASHPSVFGAGELEELGRLARSIQGPNQSNFPEAVATITSAELQALGVKYLQTIRRTAPAALRITNKMPGNFHYVGLIHLALPNARIIHVHRDPRDTALSCFSTLFATDDQLQFTYDLAELGRYIRGYQALMGHWRTVLPTGSMLEVQYEEIVDNVEEQAKRIVSHCGLQWDQACLEFHKTERIVRTASAVQVRQPIYRDSIGRWRNYEDLLRPLLRELEGVNNLAEIANHVVPLTKSVTSWPIGQS